MPSEGFYRSERPPPAARSGAARAAPLPAPPRPPHLSPLALRSPAGGSHRSGPAWRSASAVAAAAAWPRSATCGCGENRQGRVSVGGDPGRSSPLAADSGPPQPEKPGGLADLWALRPLPRASPSPTHTWPFGPRRHRWGGGPRRSLSSPAEASMASAALPRPPNCSPEPLLEAASWVLAGAGAEIGRAHV